MKTILFSALLLVLTSCSEKTASSDENVSSHENHTSNSEMGEHNMSSGDSTASEGGDVMVAVSFSSDSIVSGAKNLHTASINFTDSAGEMMHGVEVTAVEPWMQTMGHGSDTSSLDFHQHGEMGHHWMVTGLVFSMAGPAGAWVLNIDFTKDGVADSVTVAMQEIE